MLFYAISRHVSWEPHLAYVSAMGKQKNKGAVAVLLKRDRYG